MIKEYFIKHGQADFLNKMNIASIMSEQQRKLFIRLLADYIISIYGIHPTTEEMFKFVHSAVDLVPALGSAVCIVYVFIALFMVQILINLLKSRISL